MALIIVPKEVIPYSAEDVDLRTLDPTPAKQGGSGIIDESDLTQIAEQYFSGAGLNQFKPLAYWCNILKLGSACRIQMDASMSIDISLKSKQY